MLSCRFLPKILSWMLRKFGIAMNLDFQGTQQKEKLFVKLSNFSKYIPLWTSRQHYVHYPMIQFSKVFVRTILFNLGDSV